MTDEEFIRKAEKENKESKEKLDKESTVVSTSYSKFSKAI